MLNRKKNKKQKTKTVKSFGTFSEVNQEDNLLFNT